MNETESLRESLNAGRTYYTLRVGQRVVAKAPLQYGLQSPGPISVIEPGTRGMVTAIDRDSSIGGIVRIRFDGHTNEYRMANEGHAVGFAVRIADGDDPTI